MGIVYFVFFFLTFTVLEDLGTWLTSRQQLPIPGPSEQPPSGRLTGVVYTESMQKHAGELGYGYREEGRHLSVRTHVGLRKWGCFLPLGSSSRPAHRQYSSSFHCSALLCPGPRLVSRTKSIHPKAAETHGGGWGDRQLAEPGLLLSSHFSFLAPLLPHHTPSFPPKGGQLLFPYSQIILANDIFLKSQELWFRLMMHDF